jgi:hypothetical protein
MFLKSIDNFNKSSDSFNEILARHPGHTNENSDFLDRQAGQKTILQHPNDKSSWGWVPV